MEGQYNSFIPSLTVIIPAYNEEKRISKVLDEITQYIEKNNLSWNIIVSIDGNDNTENIVKEYSKKYNFISYDKKSGRNGKGNAIKRVLKYSDKEFTILMDADGSIKTDEILKNLYLAKDYDVIVFNRYGDKNNKIPIIRRILSRGFNVLVQAFLGIHIRDTQCGYKVIKTELIKKAFEKITITDAFFDVPLLYYLKNENAKFIEINVKYEHNNQNTFNIISLTLGEAISLFAFTVRHSRFYKHVPDWAKDLYYKKFRWI